MICYTRIYSPIGFITLTSDAERITGLWMEGQKHFPAMVGWEEVTSLPVFTLTESWLDRYFAGMQPDQRQIPLAPAGTVFQQKVWKLLMDIPYGSVTTYGTLARMLNCKSAQAVGNAVGRNPISILIPCHRVIGANGTFTGYAGGLERKKFLLELEKTKP